MTAVAVIGADGQLGTDLVSALERAGHRPLALAHADIEVSDAESVDQALGALPAEVVVNTAALNVDASEHDPLAAFQVNAIGCRNIAESAGRSGALVLHIGTDYVFDGKKGEPYDERDATGPINSYGISKLAGERYVLAASDANCVVRSSGLYGAAGCRAKGGMNFVTTMLKLGRERGTLSVVGDECMTPTYTRDLAEQLVTVIERRFDGVLHATSGSACSWFEFAAAILELAGVDAELTAVTGAEFAKGVEPWIRRPANTVLANERLAAAGCDEMPDWRDALARFLSEIGELSA